MRQRQERVGETFPGFRLIVQYHGIEMTLRPCRPEYQFQHRSIKVFQPFHLVQPKIEIRMPPASPAENPRESITLFDHRPDKYRRVILVVANDDKGLTFVPLADMAAPGGDEIKALVA